MKSDENDSSTPHFSDARWADFARGVGSVEGRSEMQSHLDTGCEECRTIADRLQTVVAMSANERQLVIPDECVARAKQIAEAVPSASGWIENLTVIAARLVQSSPLDWQPAGVRSLGEAPGPAGDRMLFRANDYVVHLTIEPLLGGEAAEVVGEIVNEREQEENLEGIPVQMVARGQTLSETSTNQFGEFLIEYPVRKNAMLRFALKQRGQRIDLPLGHEPENGPTGERES